MTRTLFETLFDTLFDELRNETILILAATYLKKKNFNYITSVKVTRLTSEMILRLLILTGDLC